jgi:hypothetical protein
VVLMGYWVQGLQMGGVFVVAAARLLTARSAGMQMLVRVASRVAAAAIGAEFVVMAVDLLLLLGL